MENEINKLSAEDRVLLLKAPVLVSVLAASRDHEISKNEKADAIKMAHLKTFTADPILLNYYNEAEINFVKYFEETVKKYAPFDDLKREALKKEISIINNVIAKLDFEFSKTLHNSLSKYAEHVKRSEINVLDDFIFPIPIKSLTTS
jgi:hypothetical protein